MTHIQQPDASPIPEADQLAQIEARLLRIETMLIQQQQLLAQAPDTLAMLGNMVDSTISRLQEKGVDVDQRGHLALQLLERVSQPAILESLLEMFEHPQAVKELLAMATSAPNTIAMMINIADGFIGRAIERGIEPERIMENTMESLSRFTELLQSEEFKTFISSSTFAPATLEVMGKLATSLQQANAAPEGYIGLWGALRAGRDARVQRALHFTIKMAETFGEKLANKPAQLTSKR